MEAKGAFPMLAVWDYCALIRRANHAVNMARWRTGSALRREAETGTPWGVARQALPHLLPFGYHGPGSFAFL